MEGEYSATALDSMRKVMYFNITYYLMDGQKKKVKANM